MEMLFVVLMFLLSISLILLVMFQPRQQQSLSTDATSNLGKPNYWLARRGMKLATLIVSVLFFSWWHLVYHRIESLKNIYFIYLP